MNSMFRILVVVLLAIALDAPASAADDANARFDALTADYDRWQLAHSPIRAGRRGDLEAAARWPDMSPEAVAQRLRDEREFRARLERIERKALTGTRPSSHAVLEYLLGESLDTARFAPQRMPFVNDSGFFSMPLMVAGSTRIRNVAEAEAWLKRLARLPAWLDQHIAWMKRGIEDGFVQPAIIVEGAIDIVDSIAATPVTESPLYQPLASLPAAVDAAAGEALRARAAALISEQVKPAYRRLAKFLHEDYLARPRQSIGISEVPEGREYYKVLVRQHTTLDTTPEQVHQRGLAEVKRIRAEMQQVIDRAGFDGDFDAFIDFLRGDPQFYAETPRELLMHASWIAKRIDDRMPAFFGRLPRLPYGVRPVPEHLAPTYTTGRYWPGDLENGVAGGYMVNTYALDQRPLYTLPALTLHEAVPGHHHQGALAQELEGLPEFRKQTYITAFGEGWALYAEHLGIEMGIYLTSYEHFGRLSYEMWRACRLVIDTGIHYFGWSRERAEACLLENSALARHNVRTEVARYISWPGQALAYKTGELLIRDLRRRAEARLGARFDIRAFHDAVLSDGALPLKTLERNIEDWIERNAIDASEAEDGAARAASAL